LLGAKPNISHLMARQEVRDVITGIGLLSPGEQPMQTIRHRPDAADEHEEPELGHSPFSEIAAEAS